MSKISVIIPIYNVEKYLEKCLESVINQTYKDLEIICVDDCSPDNSYKIVQEYLKKDSRIKLIKRGKNGGLSAARNSGLEIATGDYIYFLDSDDWIDLDYLEKMYNAITSKNQEAVCSTNILNVFEDGTSKPLMKRDFEEKFVPYSHACQMAWSWLLKKSFLDKFDVIFPEGLKYEDLYFFNVVIRTLGEVYAINTTTYYHFENKNSIMGSAENRTINNFDIIENLKLIYKKYKTFNKISEWSIPFFYMPKYMLNRHENKQEFYAKLRDFFEEIKEYVLSNQSLYNKMELDFFNDVLNKKDYQEYKSLDLSLIATLRKNIKTSY